MPETNCANHERLVKEIDRYNDNQADIVKGQHEIRERLAEVIASAKSAHHRIDGLAEHSEAVIRLAVSVENVVKQNEEILRQLGKHDSEITDLKLKSGRSLEDYFRHGVKYLIGAIIAYVFLIATKGGVK
jgi:septal ring factor EnvC (AmiA/AmiB activator)